MRWFARTLILSLGLIFPVAATAQTQTVAPPRLNGLSGAGAVETGQRVVLSPIFASGTSQLPYQYQWRMNGTVLPGVSAASLIIEAASAADAGTYAVTVSNDGGTSVASGELTVRPPAPIVFTTQPRTQTVQVGQLAIFSFAATGSFPRTYQWRKDGNAIAGATSLVFIISAVTTVDAASYTVAATNASGPTISDPASLTVNAATPLVYSTSSPADTTITHGENGGLSGSPAFGSSPITFQWFKDGALLAGATNQQILFSSAKPADAGKYYVVATNPAGSVTSREATLTVRAATPIAYATQPAPQSVFQGQPASFSINVSAGSQPITYQWLKDGAPLAGATTSGLRLDPVKLTDAGAYAIVATNAAGSLISTAATLTVTPAVPPAITQQPVGKTVAYYNSFNLNAGVTGTQPLAYAWKREGEAVASGRADYSVSNATATDSGVYTLTVTNVAGSVTTTPVTITVTPAAAPVITKHLASIQVSAGLQAHFRVEFTAEGTGGVSFRWLKNGQPIPGANSNDFPGFRQEYWINNVTADDAGDFSVVLTGAGGSVTSRPARLTILAATPPAIDYWPGDHYVYPNENVQFNVRPTAGSPPFSIQWFRAGAPIAGATSETLYLSQIKETELGLYSVTVANAGGIIASPDFSVSLYPAQPLPWIAAEQFGNNVYFLATSPHRIERYDLAGERWLAPTTLTDSRAPTAMVPTAEGVYLAYGRALVRRSLDLATETALVNTVSDISTLFTVDQFLYYSTAGGGTTTAVTASLRRSTLEPGPSPVGAVGNAAFAPARRVVFDGARLFPVDAEGRLGTPQWNFSLATFPTGARLILFPGEDLVANGAGSVFRLSTFSYVGSAGRQVEDLAFLANGTPLVLTGPTVRSIDAGTFVELGTAAVPFRGRRVFVSGAGIFVFGAPAASATAFQVSKLTTASFAPKPPALPVIGANDRYSIDDAFLGDDGVVHVLSRSKRALVRWSASSRALLAPVPLRAAPSRATQTVPARRALFAYSDGQITEVPLRAGDVAERQINTLGNQIISLTDLGAQVMVVGSSGPYFAPDLRFVLDNQGGLQSFTTKSDSYLPLGLGWEPTRRRYYFGPSTSFDQMPLSFVTIQPSGVIGGASGSVQNAAFPLRFSADSAFVATGNGRILNPDFV